MGLLTEVDGLPRTAGRIFGYLMLSPGESSLDELAEVLGVSKASVSTEARRLEEMGLLERRGRPGDRRDYYSIAPESFRRSLEKRIEALRRFHEILEEARAMPNASPVVRERLAEWEEVHEHILASFTDMLDRWKGRKKS